MATVTTRIESSEGSEDQWHFGLNRRFNNDWWRAIGAENRRAFGSVNIYLCPSRRSGAQFTDIFSTQTQYHMPGPRNDYVILAMHRSDSNPWTWFGGSFSPSLASSHVGPFRVAVTTPTLPDGVYTQQNIQSWQPRDTFAYWADGTSNIIIAGDKHIPTAHVGTCDPTAAGSIWDNPSPIDCSYLAKAQYNDGSWHSLVQTFTGMYDVGNPNSDWYHKPLARNPSWGNDWSVFGGHAWNRGSFSLGSNHPGVVTVLLGDGSVRGVSVTTRTRLLVSLTHVSEGIAVSLP